jgi:hypothetical protein
VRAPVTVGREVDVGQGGSVPERLEREGYLVKHRSRISLPRLAVPGDRQDHETGIGDRAARSTSPSGLSTLIREENVIEDGAGRRLSVR